MGGDENYGMAAQIIAETDRAYLEVREEIKKLEKIYRDLGWKEHAKMTKWLATERVDMNIVKKLIRTAEAEHKAIKI